MDESLLSSIHPPASQSLIESGAIMLYLADNYDKAGKISYERTTDPKRYYEMVQW
jgi:glutathione S-transferase